jgi:hypothetical protein
MSNEENQEQGQEDNQEPINPWDVPPGQMVPTLNCLCPKCKGTLGVPIQIVPLGVSQDGNVIVIESEEDAKNIKGVLFNLMVPVESFACPRCTGQVTEPEADEPKRIITL